MSIRTCQDKINRLHRDLADLQQRVSDESKREVEKIKRITSVESGISKSTSSIAVRSKQQEIARLAEDISRIQAKKADLNRAAARKTSELHRCEQDLLAEQDRERRRTEDWEKRRTQEQLARQRAITRELVAQKELSRDLSSRPRPITSLADAREAKKYHLFISHASEDKDEFVRPLAEALRRLGVEVWYDEFELKVGDSLRRCIDRGLAHSRYGVVVLSSAFFAKNWPQYELDGLVAREMAGVKVILPIWHKVSKDEVLSYSPSLADKVALNSSVSSIDEIARELSEVAVAH